MEKEPTIKEVMGVVQNLAISVQDLTESVQTGFERLETGFDRHEKILTTLVEGQQNLREILNERTDALDKRVSNTQNRVEDIVDMLEKAKKTGGVFDFNLIQHTYNDV